MAIQSQRQKKFRMKQNVNLIQDLAPGTEEVVQKGENGEKQSQHQQRKSINK